MHCHTMLKLLTFKLKNIDKKYVLDIKKITVINNGSSSMDNVELQNVLKPHQWQGTVGLQHLFSPDIYRKNMYSFMFVKDI